MIVSKSKGKWLIRIYLGRGEDGKRKYYSETFYAPIKSLVQERERELTKKLKCKVGPQTAIMTLGGYIDYHLKTLEDSDSVKFDSLELYKYYAKTIKPYVGHLQLWNLSGEMLNEALAGKFRKMATRSRKNLYDFTAKIVRAAIAADRTPGNALSNFKIPKAGRIEREVLTGEDLVKVLGCAKGYRYGLAIELLIVTGARAGEILGLCWDRVDFKLNRIIINRTMNLQHRILSDDPKTYNSLRTIELDDLTMYKLKVHYEQQKKELEVFNPKGLIFQTKNGRTVCYKTIQKTWNTILKKAGFDKTRVHNIRHSLITYLYDKGTPLIKIAELTGDDINTLNRTYAHKNKKSKAINFQ